MSGRIGPEQRQHVLLLSDPRVPEFADRVQYYAEQRSRQQACERPFLLREKDSSVSLNKMCMKPKMLPIRKDFATHEHL